jgi:hypothetical protein
MKFRLVQRMTQIWLDYNRAFSVVCLNFFKCFWKSLEHLAEKVFLPHFDTLFSENIVIHRQYGGGKRR